MKSSSDDVDELTAPASTGAVGAGAPRGGGDRAQSSSRAGAGSAA